MFTAQKMMFFIKDFFSKCGQMWIWSHLLKKYLMKNLTFCAVVILKRISEYFQDFDRKL